ncbi:MAG: hypothetical protein ABF608_09065 [Sporolactobacillus sp.]
MKEIIRENIDNLPYSLHDARVNRLKFKSEKLTLYFKNGYFKLIDNDDLPVCGHIEIDGVDPDYCAIYLIDRARDHGVFKGKKYRLKKFIKRHPVINFEIIYETYGYNQSRFSGFFYHGKKIKECTLAIYHFGPMTYVTEE